MPTKCPVVKYAYEVPLTSSLQIVETLDILLKALPLLEMNKLPMT